MEDMTFEGIRFTVREDTRTYYVTLYAPRDTGQWARFLEWLRQTECPDTWKAICIFGIERQRNVHQDVLGISGTDVEEYS